jgi:hypothetical protein
MTSRLTEVIVDCTELEVMADFWCAALDYARVNAGEGWLAIGRPDDDNSDAPRLAFVVVPEPRSGKNRVHIDVTPDGATQAEEVERLIGLGARPVDIGQGSTPWVVMADPENNEFCVMPGTESDESDG